MAQKLDALYYEIEARTTGFEQSLDEAGKRVEKLADFIKRKPGIAAAAVVAAILSIGVAATKMAADVDREGRKLEGVFPKVQRQVEALSNEFGVAQTNLFKLYKTIQDRGVSSPEGLTQAATAALQLNQALRGTPEQLEGLSNALGDVRDLFHIDVNQSGTLAATLFAMTQGKVPLGDFLGDLQAAAPTIREFGLSLNQAGPALIQFRQEGLNTSRQVATALREELTRGDGALHDHAAAALSAADAQKKFAEQVERTGSEAGVAGQKIQERFNNALIELGTKILPLAARWMENVVVLMDKMSGRQGAFDSLDNLQAFGDRLRNGIRTPGDTQAFWGANNAFKNLREQINDGDLSLGELGHGQLEALRRALQQLEPLFARMPEQREQMAKMRQEINQLLASPDGATAPPPGDSHGGGSLESRVAGLNDQLNYLADWMTSEVIARLPQVAAQIRNAAGAQAEFNKALADANAEGSQIKQAARAYDEKQAKQLEDALHRIKSEGGDTTNHVRETGRAIEQAVEGTLDLANAFGLVSDATQDVLRNLGQVAAGIGPLADAIGKMHGKDGKGASFADTANLIGAALPVVGGVAQLIAGVFGDSAAEKARQAVVRENTAAIQTLTREVGNFGLPGVTGKGYASALSATAGLDSLSELVAQGIVREINNIPGSKVGPTIYSDADQQKLDAYLAAAGTSRAELQKVAQELGLQVDFLSGSAQETAKAFQQLNQALAAVELTKFAHTFAGQLDAFNAGLSLFNVQDPLGKLTRLLQVLGSDVGSPALAAAFAGLDITSAQGQAEAVRRLQALFGQLTQGTLDPSALGGLTGDEFLSLLTQLKDLVDQVGAGGTQGQSQSWVVDRSITEVRGQRLEASLGTIALYSADIAANTALMADLLSRLAIAGGLLLPPDAGGGPYLGGGGAALVIQQLVIQIGPGVDPAAAGAAAAGALVTELDTAFGNRGQQRNQWGGTA